jgi:hypothetical protein
MADENLEFRVIAQYEGAGELEALERQLKTLRAEMVRLQAVSAKARREVRRALLDDSLEPGARKSKIRQQKIVALQHDDEIADQKKRTAATAKAFAEEQKLANLNYKVRTSLAKRAAAERERQRREEQRANRQYERDFRRLVEQEERIARQRQQNSIRNTSHSNTLNDSGLAKQNQEVVRAAQIREKAEDSSRRKELEALQAGIKTRIAREQAAHEIRVQQAKDEDARQRRSDDERSSRLRRDIIERSRISRDLGTEAAINAQSTTRRRRAQEQEEIRRQRILENTQREIGRGIEQAQRAQGGIGEGARRWLFTLRRVVLVYGAIRGAQLAITATQQALVGSIKFGNELERAPKAIAGIAAATFDVRDASGQLLGPVEAYQAVLAKARQQLEGLKRDAIGSASTFEELQENFLTAIGPGATSNIALDEIREFTVSISEIAAVTGQAQNQLAEEIRALFTGDIRTKDSRIARLLSINGNDIRRVQEAGTQVEFLRERFAAFKQSTKDLENTLPRIFSDLTDAAKLAGAEGMEPLRQELALLGAELRGLVIDKESTQLINPKLAKAIKPIGEALARAVRGFAAAGEEVAQFTAALLTLASQGLASVAQFSTGIGAMFNVFALAANTATAFLRVLTEFFALFPKWTQQILGTVGGLGLLVLAMRGLFLATGRVLTSFTKFVRFVFAARAAAVGLAVGTNAAAVGTSRLSRAMLFLARRILLPLAVITAALVGLDRLINKFKEVRAVFEGAEKGVRLFFSRIVGDSDQESLDLKKKLDEGAGVFSNDNPFETLLKEALGAVTQGMDLLIGAVEDYGTQSRAKLADIFTFKDVRDQLKESRELFDINLGFADAADSGEVFSAVLETQAELLREEQKALRDLNREITKREVDLKALGDDPKTLAKRNSIAAEIKELEADRTASAGEFTNELQNQLQILLRQREVTTQIAIEEQQRALAVTKASAGITDRSVFADQLSEYLEGLSRVADLQAELEASERRSLRIQVESVDLVKRIADQQTLAAEAGAALVIYPNIAVDLKDQALELEQATQDAIKESIKLEQQRLKELEKQNSARTGINRAITDQIRDLTAAENFNRFVTDASNALRNGLSTGILDAFDPRAIEKLGFGEIGLNIGLDIARSFGQALLDQAVFQPLFKGIGSLLDLDLTSPADLANQAALATNTAAMTALGGTIAVNSAITSANTAGIAALTTAIYSDAGSSVVETAATVVAAESRGGYIKGFDTGGPASGPVLAKPVPGLDPRDRIQALMRKGEYVVTPEMERREPGLYSYLEHLRRRTHGLSGAGKLPPSIARRDSFQPRGFATGGSTSTAAASVGSSRGEVTVLPVLVRTPREIDRIVASPSFARGAMMHRSVLRMIQNPRPD